MPMLTRECLAHRFRQNWLAKNPGDTVVGSQLDDSLTSLSWLQNLNIMKLATPTPPASPSSITDRVPLATPASAVFNNNITNSHMDANDLRVNPNAVLNMTNMNGRVDVTSPGVDSGYTSICRTLGRVEVHPPQTTTHVDKVDYKTNPFVKPPYSYATLICMAMKESKRNKITLSGIYSWITDNFMYYRVADPSWQNSIRHNLSLNKCFQKVPRRKDEPGKGGFWRINPEYSDMFVNGIFKKRRSSTRENVAPAPAPAAKRFKRDSDEVSLHDATRLLNSPYIKSEPEEAVRHLAVSEGMTEALSGDFSWSAILQQDIQVGGVRIKTEDIIDNNIDDSKLVYEAEYAASPITELSPPPSDSNSDVGLDDLLSTDLEPVDLSNGDPLDLTVQGQSIQPPEWWNESLTRGIFTHLAASHSSSGLHTPLASSPIHETDYSHPWAENRSDLDEAIANFDLDLQNLFEDDSLTGPVLCDS